MYNSPIDVITRQLRTQQEDHVFKAVQEVGITVDKEELLKALKYDRDQYNNGYHNGYHDALVARSMLAEDIKESVAREIFEEIDRMIFGTVIPNECAIISTAQLAELKKKYTEGK